MGKEWLYHWGSNSSSSNRSSRKRGKTSSSRGQIRDGSGSSSSSSSSTSTRTSSASFSGCMNAIFQLFDLHQFHFPNLHPQQPPSSSSSSSSSFNHPHDFFLPQLQPPIHLKGVEAPRNSLEMEDTSFMGAPTSISSNSTMKQEDIFKISMGGIQIKTSGHTRSSRRTTYLNGLSSSECVYSSSSSSSSPAGTKTPTLVARLMGLDLLPETSSPRPSSSPSVSNLSSSKSQLHHQQVQNPIKKQKNDDVMMGSRSLPNTPRTSSARRSDVDQRFSLQINKENNNNELATSQEFEFSKFLTTKIAAAAAADRRSKGDETESPSHYAKQIVKQFKENVSRRVGRDITNTVENNRSEQRRDQHVILLKSKKPPSSNIGDCHDHDHDQSTAPNSCSPRLRFLEIKSKTSHSPKLSTSPLSPLQYTAQSKSTATVATSKPKAQSVPPKEEQQQIMTQQSSSQKCNKIDSERLYGARLKKPLVRSKKEESFVRSSSATSSTRANANHLSEKKKCKQTPLSNVSTILLVKKDPPPPATRLPQQQEKQKQYDQSAKVFDDTLLSRKSTELPSCSSQSYKQERNSIITVTDINSNGGTTTVSSTTGSAELIECISRILECTGIHEFTPMSFTKWYSPSHPLDPSLFHNLRFSYPKLDLNREKLVFDVVDELLAEILRPLMNLKPRVNWIARNDQILMYGWQLIDTLFARIRSFPSADCRVLEDIDAVVEKDLGSGRERSSAAAATFEEEGDGIVIEIEGDIVDTLVHEIVVAMVV